MTSSTSTSTARFEFDAALRTMRALFTHAGMGDGKASSVARAGNC